MSETHVRSSLTTDEALDLLANDERRQALSALRAADHPVPLADLAEATAARADDCDREDVTDEERERAAAALHHQHLPRLADASVVEYDRDENRVALTEVAEELEPFLTMLGADA